MPFITQHSRSLGVQNPPLSFSAVSEVMPDLMAAGRGREESSLRTSLNSYLLKRLVADVLLSTQPAGELEPVQALPLHHLSLCSGNRAAPDLGLKGKALNTLGSRAEQGTRSARGHGSVGSVGQHRPGEPQPAGGGMVPRTGLEGA